MNRLRGSESEAGYNLVVLLVLFSLMSVMAAAVLPALKKQIQREKEAELIFRGLQYAEGIRVFQQRFGRYPTSLEELIELEPRSMRQLWKDPMTKDGRWAFVLASAARPAGGGNGADGEDGQGRNVAGGAAPRSGFRRDREDRDQGQPVGPILGVVSRAKGTAGRSFLGKDKYEEWRFTPSLLPKPRVVPGTEIVVRGNVELIGKPFPRGLQPRALGQEEGRDVTGGEAPEDLFDEGDGG